VTEQAQTKVVLLRKRVNLNCVGLFHMRSWWLYSYTCERRSDANFFMHEKVWNAPTISENYIKRR